MRKLLNRASACLLAIIFAFALAQGALAENLTGASECSRGEDCPISAYRDADSAAWYHDSVHFCLENDLLMGNTKGKLLPNEDITCGMAAMILYRIEGQPDEVGDSVVSAGSFPDWCEDAMQWAYSCGVLLESDRAEAEKAVSWSLLQSMVSRYGVYKGFPMEQGAQEAGIADADSVAFARLEDGSSVSRAQASELFYRLCVYMDNGGVIEPVPEADAEIEEAPQNVGVSIIIIIVCIAAVAAIAIAAAVTVTHRRKRKDDTPMVSYDIAEDEI
jgi:hypothetical protein